MELLDTWLDSNLKDSFVLDSADLLAKTKSKPTKIPEDPNGKSKALLPGPTSPNNLTSSKNGKSPENSEANEIGASTSPSNFFDRWMKSLYSKIKPQSSVQNRKVYRREVRSAFGWTDVPEKEAEEEILDESSETKKSTFSEQDKLPTLPVPDLKVTCAKYLKTIEPLSTPEEYAKSVSAVEEFLQPGGIGEKLQEMLIQRAASGTMPSWLEPWWDDAYLCDREPIPINVNYFFVFEDHPSPEKNNQIGRAASLLRGALIFKTLLDKGKVEPDYERDKPLCMSQYPRVFGASRIPGLERDSIITYSKHKPSGRDALSKTTEYVEISPTHVIVLYRNQFYWFDAIVNDSVISLSEIESNLTTIVNSPTEDIDYPIGLFTAQERTRWAKLRQQLISLDEINKQTLEKIQSALMIVVLDSAAPSSLDELSRLILHGPITNRWFDKHQLIVCSNGQAGVIFEHSVGDGTTTLRVADEMYKYSVKHGNAQTSSAKTLTHKLTWKVNQEIESELEDCYETFRRAILDNETSTLEFHQYGGQFIKDSNMSPDGYVQIAMQLAYYKMFGRCGATYESASTRGFLHGRTETVRTVSNESLQFVKSSVSPLVNIQNGKQVPAQLSNLRKAVDQHVKYMRDAKEGKGVDRHLFGLRMLFESNFRESGIPTPLVFADPAYRRSSHWYISTSHCGSSSLKLFGFGPVVTDGFGVGYMIKNNSIHFNITSKYTAEMTSSPIFARLLEESLIQMQAICLSNPEKRDAPSISLNFTHPTSSAEFHYKSWQPKQSTAVSSKQKDENIVNSKS